MVKDLDSLTAVYRQRKGEVRRHIESCDALLVTTNTTLAHVSRTFFSQVFTGRSVPICMSDYALATSGDVGAFASGTIAQVLHHAEEAARAEVEGELELERVRREQAEVRAASETDRAAAEAARAERLTVQHADRLDTRAGEVAKWLSWAAFGAAVILLFAACAAAAQGVFPSSWSRAVPLGSALVFLLGVSSLISLATGWNLLASRRWLAGRLQPAVSRKLHQWFGPPDAS